MLPTPTPWNPLKAEISTMSLPDFHIKRMLQQAKRRSAYFLRALSIFWCSIQIDLQQNGYSSTLGRFRVLSSDEYNTLYAKHTVNSLFLSIFLST
jgi:hypothetical protein